MRVLTRYVANTFLRTLLLVAGSLTGLLSLLEFVDQLASVGQGHYRVPDALVFVVLTAPARLLQVMPVSMLLAALLALGGFGRNSELVAMLAVGASERRIVGCLLWLVLPVAIGLLALTQLVIPPAQRLAQERRAAELASADPARSGDSVWVGHDRQYLHVDRFNRADHPVGIDIYSFAPDGALDTLLHAERATIRADGTWLLAGVTRRTAVPTGLAIDRLSTLPWHSFISPRQIRFLVLPLDSAPPLALLREVRALHGPAAWRYEQELWSRIRLPLVLAAMTMLAAPFVFGTTRNQNTGRHLARGVAIGIAFSLAQSILDRLGALSGISPALTALLPALAVILLALQLFRRMHRRPGLRRATPAILPGPARKRPSGNAPPAPPTARQPFSGPA